MKKKPQKIRLEVDAAFADLIPFEIFNFLRNRYNLNNRVYPISVFEDDPVAILEVRFFASDEQAIEIDQLLRCSYEFKEEE